MLPTNIQIQSFLQSCPHDRIVEILMQQIGELDSQDVWLAYSEIIYHVYASTITIGELEKMVDSFIKDSDRGFYFDEDDSAGFIPKKSAVWIKMLCVYMDLAVHLQEKGEEMRDLILRLYHMYSEGVYDGQWIWVDELDEFYFDFRKDHMIYIK
jgi:hypothetical protein